MTMHSPVLQLCDQIDRTKLCSPLREINLIPENKPSQSDMCKSTPRRATTFRHLGIAQSSSFVERMDISDVPVSPNREIYGQRVHESGQQNITHSDVCRTPGSMLLKPYNNYSSLLTPESECSSVIDKNSSIWRRKDICSPVSSKQIKKWRSFRSPAVRLSLSSRKSYNEQGNKYDYDPEEDIFLGNKTPMQYDNLARSKIERVLDKSGETNYSAKDSKLKKSVSIATFDTLQEENICKQTRTSDEVHNGYDNKSRSVKSCRKLCRTSSVPNLWVLPNVTPRRDVTNEKSKKEVITAILEAREMIDRISKKTKDFNSFKLKSHTPKKSELKDDWEENSTDLPATQPILSLILQGIVAYVDVVSGNENRSFGVEHELKKLGATVVDSFTKAAKITHVIFNDGRLSTYKKAKARQIPLVSVLWIDACRNAGAIVSERLYVPRNIEKYESPNFMKQLKRRKIVDSYIGRKRRAITPKQSKMQSLLDNTPELKSSVSKPNQQKSFDWVNAVVGENKLVQTLVDVADIAPTQLKKIVNSSHLPVEAETYENTSLAVRLLKKFIPCREQNLPIKENKMCESEESVNNSIEMKERNVNFVANGSKTENSTFCLAESSIDVTGDSQESISTPGRKKTKTKRKLFRLREDEVVDNCTDSGSSYVIENPHKEISQSKNEKQVTRKRLVSSQQAVNKKNNSQINTSIRDDNTHNISLANSRLSFNTVSMIRRSRRSSIDFISLTDKNVHQCDVHRGIVYTLLSSSEQDILMSVVSTLGGFVIEKYVTDQTTHVVCKEPKRTIKMLKGMARGCWIVSYDWILKSVEAEQWLDEEEFEMTSFSQSVQKYRLEKLSFGPLFRPDTFSSCGPIYVSSKCIPPSGDIVELLILCGGIITKKNKSRIVIGELYPEAICVNVLWVLDSVTHYLCQQFENYLLSK